MENPEDDPFLDDLQAAVRKILKSNKASKADQIAAVNAGIKIAAIKHKISGGDEKGFFDK
jgi:hypothetical protein